MPSITISLNDGLFAELQRAAIRTHEPGFGAADFATEAVESVLESRRLPRVTLGRGGARVARLRTTEAEPEPMEPAGHRVLLPERVCH